VFSASAPVVIGGTVLTTMVIQNVEGSNSNTGFFFRPNDPTYADIVPGWTVEGQPTWVVTSATSDPGDQYSTSVTITGGTFISGQSYAFTGIDIGGTDFEAEYNVYDVFVANNEYFTVEAIANTTHMVVDRQPMNQYSGVFAYKIQIPTYAFSSVPTSINEGANGTFNVTTTNIANGTALYWTINNVTTSAGDFA
jgi:hypothetical protein